jgi:predicted kinase
MHCNGNNTATPELVVMMGLPAAGKSWVAEGRYTDTHSFVDCDAIKETHPDYDPLNPQTIHDWSKAVAETQMQEAFSNPTNTVYDSTGTNSKKVIRYVESARAAGMTTRLVFVTVGIDTSITRNANRPRVVPEHIIREKADKIYQSFDIVSELFDVVEKVINE